MEQDFLIEIAESAKARGIEPSTLCRKAGLGGDFIARIKSGGGFSSRTVTKFRDYIAENPPPASETTEQTQAETVPQEDTRPATILPKVESNGCAQ